MKPAGAREGMKLTYDDFLLSPDDGKRHELIDGEHHVTPSPNTKHQRVSGNLHFHIRAWLENHPIGQAGGHRSVPRCRHSRHRSRRVERLGARYLRFR